MILSFEIPKYRANINKIAVKSDKNSIGTFNQFNNNVIMEKIGRHISSTFVSNLKINSKDTNYEFILKNQFKAFVSTASWIVKENNEQIGEISEKPVGKTLVVKTKKGDFEIKSEITSLREIKIFDLSDNKHNEIAVGKRNFSIQKPQFEMRIDMENLELSPVFFAGLCYLRNS